ncbi:hypothetical protein ACFL1S_02700 [Pseudomonadota bacterium]
MNAARTLLALTVTLSAATLAQGIDIQYGVVGNVSKSQTSGSDNNGIGAVAGGKKAGAAHGRGKRGHRCGNPQSQDPLRRLEPASNYR